MEKWCWIPGYEDLYRISEKSEVWSKPRTTTRGGVLRHIIGTRNYHWVTLTKDGKQRRFQVHRLILLAFEGPCPEGQEVRHLDGNPENNNLDNLSYGTHSENLRDRRKHGTDPQVNKTHCPSGHEYTRENTYRHPDGRRFCRICARKNGLRIYYEKKAVGKGWVPSAELPPDKLEHRRALARERMRRYTQRKQTSINPNAD
jgi:hypothetical protein